MPEPTAPLQSKPPVIAPPIPTPPPTVPLKSGTASAPTTNPTQPLATAPIVPPAPVSTQPASLPTSVAQPGKPTVPLSSLPSTMPQAASAEAAPLASTESTSPSSTDTSVEEAPAQLPKKGGKKILVFLVLLIILLASGGGVFAYLYTQGYVSLPFALPFEAEPEVQVEKKPAPTPVPTAEFSEALIFKQNSQLWRRDASGDIEQITTDALVTDFAVDATVQSFAYVQGREKLLESGVKLIEPIAVYLAIDGGKPEKIFDLEPTPTEPASEFVLQLKDLTFSPDGKTLAFSTSDSIYFYNLATKEQKTFYSQPITDPLDKGLIYSYYDLDFSPDGSRLIVKRGYYEWFDQIVFEASTAVFQDIKTDGPRGSFATWLDNENMVMVDGQIVSEADPDAQDTFTLSKIALATGLKEQLLQGSGTITHLHGDNQQIYFTVIKMVKTGKTINDIEETRQEIALQKYVFASQQTEQLWKSEDITSFFVTGFEVRGKKLLFTVARDPNPDAVKDVYLFDPANPLDGMIKLEEGAELSE